MYNLVLKDIRVQKKMVLFGILYSIFLFIAFANPIFSGFIYVMGAIALSYVFIMNAPMLEEKNKVDMVINSLPLKRHEVVMARYISVPVFIILSLLLIQVIGILLQLVPIEYFHNRLINGWDIAITFTSVMLLASFYLPLLYWLGPSFTRIFFMIVFLLIFFAPANLHRFIVENPQHPLVQSAVSWYSTGSPGLMAAGLAVVLLILFAVSACIAIKVYQAKDL